MVTILDYGMGNLASVQKALAHLGAETAITRDVAAVAVASHVILPGVGAFRDAIAALRESGLDAAFLQAVETGKPCLGICLGMQMLFERSMENGDYEGLGLIPGRIERLPEAPGIKIPHMGWNSLFQLDPVMYADIPEQPHMYFVHSYGFLDTGSEYAAALCEHGRPFVCAVRRGNLWGTQFHPEKSGSAGLALLRNFLRAGEEAAYA